VSDRSSAYDPEQVVVRDKRRIDPTTGAAREGVAPGPPPTGAPGAGPPPAAAPSPVAETAPEPGAGAGTAEPAAGSDPVAELTADLQRVSAEYANYRKRVARDQAAVGELATAVIVDRLLPLLDDIDRAREHGDLDGAFKVVGEGLEGVVGRLGVERFGAPGDAFDPKVHEAVMSAPEDPSATVATCVQVFSPGYRFASGRVLRPAKVVVADPGGVPGAEAEELAPVKAASPAEA